MEQRVLPCTACHGKQGRATPEGYFPRIAGKPAGYLYNQLRHFRDGKRRYPPMAYLLSYLSDDYLAEIARHFSELQLPYAAPAPASVGAALLARGEQLVRSGDTARELPACKQCHGARLTGVAPFVPSLLGLSQDYLSSQLGAWRTGQRHASEPDCMAQVARRMALADVQAVAAWLAAQPVPGGGQAAADFTQAPPLDCGSLNVRWPPAGLAERAQ
ncbi:c-type cytochrome [Comamonas sp. NLF-1-9]|uniref:c-type cytochrome n=1 Tax=Comamonas sp. NLF-1-9 TaxID=2853163 RepID=UPI001C4926A1|nr:c-type cytochrome [Comamonas sp. NLF-1-9]QXL85806.1 c-type cytochrome [Comamonas sp. NLF-1-9]